MKEYRAYVLTSAGTILSIHFLHCEDHAQAVERAEALAVANAVELWDPPFWVARFEPKG